jgi:hypothetical protein
VRFGLSTTTEELDPFKLAGTVGVVLDIRCSRSSLACWRGKFYGPGASISHAKRNPDRVLVARPPDRPSFGVADAARFFPPWGEEPDDARRRHRSVLRYCLADFPRINSRCVTATRSLLPVGGAAPAQSLATVRRVVSYDSRESRDPIRLLSDPSLPDTVRRPQRRAGESILLSLNDEHAGAARDRRCFARGLRAHALGDRYASGAPQ